MTELIDRKRQLHALRDLSAQDGSHMALVYGRRRVGKTFLLDHVWDDEERFYYLAGDTTPDRNRRGLLLELAEWLKEPLQPEDYPNWRTVFRRLAQIARERPLVVILDEFQYLLGTEEGVSSQLNAIWDREVDDADLTLVLCGSEVATMESLQASDSPLFGRIDWREKLLPFDYRDAARMVPGRDRRTQVYFWGIFGGIPQYLASIREGEALGDAVARTFLAPQGSVHLQLEHLIQQESGIRNPGVYRAVLEAVGQGHTTTNDIARAAGLQGQTMTTRRALETLESLELVCRERNFRAGSRAALHNRIADNALQFWNRFISPNRSRLETSDPTRVWSEKIAPQLDTYMGRIFEKACVQALERHHAAWGLPAPLDVARWEGQDRSRRSIEIDMVAELDDSRLLTGEFKWSSSPVDVDIHFGLVRDLEDLANSGQGWANDALDPDASHGYLYISAGGFSDAFRSRAADDDRIHLVELDDMFV